MIEPAGGNLQTSVAQKQMFLIRHGRLVIFIFNQLMDPTFTIRDRHAGCVCSVRA